MFSKLFALAFVFLIIFEFLAPSIVIADSPVNGSYTPVVDCSTLSSVPGGASLCYDTKKGIYGSIDGITPSFANKGSGLFEATSSPLEPGNLGIPMTDTVIYDVQIKDKTPYPSPLITNATVAKNKRSTLLQSSGVWGPVAVAIANDGTSYKGKVTVSSTQLTTVTQQASNVGGVNPNTLNNSTSVTPASTAAASGSSGGTDQCGGWWAKMWAVTILPFAPAASVSVAMCNAMVPMVDMLQYSISNFLGPSLEYVMNMPARMMDSNVTPNALKDAWQNILVVTLSLLTLALLIIAFANILNVDEKLGYGLNRMIPKIIISIVAAYFSYLFTRFLLDLASAFQAGLFHIAGNPLTGSASDQGFTAAVNVTDVFKSVTFSGPMFILLFVLLIVLFLATAWLFILLTVRVAMLWILVALAPMAMLMNIMPFTESYYKQWWAEWWKWLFMGPAVALMIYLASAVLTSFQASFTTGNDFQAAMMLIMAAVCVFMAGTIPLTMGGKVMSSVTGAMKKGVNFAGQKSGVNDFLAQRKTSNAARPRARAAKFQARMAQGGGFSRFIAGTDQQQAKAAKATLLDTIAKEQLVGIEDPKALAKFAKENKGLESQAAIFKAANSGLLDTDDVELMGMTAQMAAADPVLASAIQKNQKEAWNGMYTALSSPGKNDEEKAAIAKYGSLVNNEDLGLRGKADRSIGGTATPDLKAEHIEFLAKHDKSRLESLIKDEAGVQKLMETGTLKQKAALGQAVRYLDKHGSEAEFKPLVEAFNSTSETQRAALGKAMKEAESWEARDGAQKVADAKRTGEPPKPGKPIWDE